RRITKRSEEPIFRENVDMPIDRVRRGNFHIYNVQSLHSHPPTYASVRVHWLRSKQHGLRFPALSLEQILSTRRLRVSNCLAEPIQRIQSQRAIGVIAIHIACASGSLVRTSSKSIGTFGSGHSLVGSIVIATISPAPTPVAASLASLTRNQWL